MRVFILSLSVGWNAQNKIHFIQYERIYCFLIAINLIDAYQKTYGQVDWAVSEWVNRQIRICIRFELHRGCYDVRILAFCFVVVFLYLFTNFLFSRLDSISFDNFYTIYWSHLNFPIRVHMYVFRVKRNVYLRNYYLCQPIESVSRRFGVKTHVYCTRLYIHNSYGIQIALITHRTFICLCQRRHQQPSAYHRKRLIASSVTTNNEKKCSLLISLCFDRINIILFGNRKSRKFKNTYFVVRSPFGTNKTFNYHPFESINRNCPVKMKSNKTCVSHKFVFN